MNKFQAKLSTFFIKDKEKRAFIEKLITDKFFYKSVEKSISCTQKKKETVENFQSKLPASRYEIFKLRETKIGRGAAINEFLSEYLPTVKKSVEREIKNIKFNDVNKSNSENFSIFTMWLQDNSPELVQMCFASIKRFYPDIIIITEKNLADYVKIPKYIWSKFKKGIIPAAQFSDYVRVALLDKYGGIWIDATYYMLAPIPQYMIKAKTFVLKNHEKNMISNNFLKFEKNNYLIKTMKIFLEQYWKNEDFLIDYFFFHLFFMLSVKNNSQCAKIWNDIPYALNTNPQILGRIFSQNFDSDMLKYIRQTSFMYKLTYKDKAAENNQNSWYWYLINQWHKGNILTCDLETNA